MDHGGEAARPTTMECTDLGMAGAVQGAEANMSTGTFHGQLSAAAAGRAGVDGFQPSAAAFHSSTVFARQVRSVPVAVFHREPIPGGAYTNIGEFWRQPGPVRVVLVGPQLPEGVVAVHDNYYGYSALQPHPGAGPGVVLAALLPLPGGIGAVYNGDYPLQLRPGAGRSEARVGLLPDDVAHGLLPSGGGAAYDDYGYNALQPRPGAGHGDEVLVDLLPDDIGHAPQGEVFVGLLPGGGVAAYDNYGYNALQPRPGARHGDEVLVDLLPDGAGHGEVFVGLLSSGVDAVYNDYGYYAWQPRPGAGSGQEFIGPLPDGVGAVFDNPGNFFAQQTVPHTGHADGTVGALRDPNNGAGYYGSGALADDDLGAVYDNPGMVAGHLRRLLPLAGIGACSVAVNGLAAAGPGSPAVAFHLLALLLGGLLLVILHVLRV